MVSVVFVVSLFCFFLSYSIQNFDSGKEIAVIRMYSDNVQYEMLKLRAVMDPISNTKKMIPSGTYAGRELPPC